MNLSGEAVAAPVWAIRINVQEITRRKAFLEFDGTDASLLTELHEHWCSPSTFCDISRILPRTVFTVRAQRLLLLAAVSSSDSLPPPLPLLSWPHQFSHGRGQFLC